MEDESKVRRIWPRANDETGEKGEEENPQDEGEVIREWPEVLMKRVIEAKNEGPEPPTAA